jgi:hypothetical protein
MCVYYVCVNMLVQKQQQQKNSDPTAATSKETNPLV